MPENPSCLCGSNQSRTIFDSVFDYRRSISGRFSVVQCTECGLVYTSPRPTKEEISDFYPPDYGAHIDYDEEDAVSKIRKAALRGRLGLGTGGFSLLPRIIGGITKNYSSLVPRSQDPGRILDIGCGNGRFLQELIELGWTCFGVEMDERAAIIARKKGCNVLVGSFENLDLPRDFFDVVRLNHVLEHSYDPVEWLRKIARILRVGGEVYIGIPDYDSLTRRLFGKYACNLDIPRHLYHFDRRAIERLLSETGFTITSLSYNSFHSDYVIVSVGNIFRHRLKIHSKLGLSIYVTPLPLLSRLLDRLNLGDNIEIAARRNDLLNSTSKRLNEKFDGGSLGKSNSGFVRKS
jgi:SAM-dependent methyltransferase